MNGFILMADSYRKLLEQGLGDDKEINSQIKIFDFLGELSHDEICMLFDSSAFNEIMFSYCYEALQNIKLDENTISKAINELRHLVDTKQAKEILD